MEIDIVKEVHSLKVGLLSVINKNPLPMTVKAMIFREIVLGMGVAEAKEIKDLESRIKAEIQKEDKKEG